MFLENHLQLQTVQCKVIFYVLMSVEQNEVQEFEYGVSGPRITRKKISIYEYSGLFTQISEYFSEIHDLDKYVDSNQINNIISPGRLAFDTLTKGIIDVQIDRGYETVLFSKSKRDKLIEKEIDGYLTQREEDRQKELIEKSFANSH